jgi:hypothetical protein
MANTEIGSVWEVYSPHEGRWVRVVVAKVDNDQVALRYEGTLELLTVDLGDLQNSPDRFRVPSDGE